MPPRKTLALKRDLTLNDIDLANIKKVSVATSQRNRVTPPRFTIALRPATKGKRSPLAVLRASLKSEDLRALQVTGVSEDRFLTLLQSASTQSSQAASANLIASVAKRLKELKGESPAANTASQPSTKTLVEDATCNSGARIRETGQCYARPVFAEPGSQMTASCGYTTGSIVVSAVGVSPPKGYANDGLWVRLRWELDEAATRQAKQREGLNPREIDQIVSNCKAHSTYVEHRFALLSQSYYNAHYAENIPTYDAYRRDMALQIESDPANEALNSSAQSTAPSSNATAEWLAQREAALVGRGSELQTLMRREGIGSLVALNPQAVKEKKLTFDLPDTRRKQSQLEAWRQASEMLLSLRLHHTWDPGVTLREYLYARKDDMFAKFLIDFVRPERLSKLMMQRQLCLVHKARRHHDNMQIYEQDVRAKEGNLRDIFATLRRVSQRVAGVPDPNLDESDVRTIMKEDYPEYNTAVVALRSVTESFNQCCKLLMQHPRADHMMMEQMAECGPTVGTQRSNGTFIGHLVFECVKLVHGLCELWATGQNKLINDVQAIVSGFSYDYHTTMSPLCFILQGPAGTGKTYCAQVMSRIFNACGFLTRGSGVSIKSGTDFKGAYLGQSGPKTVSLLNEHLDSVLVIDEAYTLSVRDGKNGWDSYGKEALDALVNWTTQHEGDIVIIAIGYEKQMNEFLQVNEGLPRRFPYKPILDAPPAALMYTSKFLGALFTSSEPLLSADIQVTADGRGIELDDRARAYVEAVILASRLVRPPGVLPSVDLPVFDSGASNKKQMYSVFTSKGEHDVKFFQLFEANMGAMQNFAVAVKNDVFSDWLPNYTRYRNAASNKYTVADLRRALYKYAQSFPDLQYMSRAKWAAFEASVEKVLRHNKVVKIKGMFDGNCARVASLCGSRVERARCPLTDKCDAQPKRK